MAAVLSQSELRIASPRKAAAVSRGHSHGGSFLLKPPRAYTKMSPGSFANTLGKPRLRWLWPRHELGALIAESASNRGNHTGGSSLRLSITLPESMDSNAKGVFFESFVADLIRPMRLRVTSRVSFTGMEIDLLARDEDQPRTILVECKAQADPLGADVVTKLLGMRTVRKADAAWLFATSDLTKGGRGLVDDIHQDHDLARTFAWFPAERICELLIQQRCVVSPSDLAPTQPLARVDDWTLVVEPGGWLWLGEVIAGGLPSAVVAFEARSGSQLDKLDYARLGSLGERYEALPVMAPADSGPTQQRQDRSPVARVVSGEAWEDPRPSRPIDFVGRDELIRSVGSFFEAVRTGATETRSFALQAPSGWGKSSLTLKLADLANRGRLFRDCSVTAIDSRSAMASDFVAESVRLAFLDAAKRGLIRKRDYDLSSIRHPLQSKSLTPAFDELVKRQGLVVLVFDQFEELFAKEHLFEAFNAVRELALDLDSMQVPVLLGFAWKTDIALPQQHPAYHVWHELADRRRSFAVQQFGSGDSRRVITKAEGALGKKLTPALRARLVEQCQGLPWLLKKLLVHVLQRVTTPESQYLLIERELDVEALFLEDLSALPEEAVNCLRHIAQLAPVPVPDVEKDFGHNTANLLLNSKLIVRSGMNYVIYWDIFRDYLVEGTVPQIPWSRTFQRDPRSGVRAIQALNEHGSLSAAELARALGTKEGACFNLLGDLVALQLVDRVRGDQYCVASIIDGASPATIARHARGQLERHVVTRAIASCWERGERFSPERWDDFFASCQPRAGEFAPKTIHYYAANLRRWLVFSGLLDRTGSYLHLPAGSGEQMGVLGVRRSCAGYFLGTTAPERLVEMLEILRDSPRGVSRDHFQALGLRNAVADALALGLVSARSGGPVLPEQRVPGAVPRDALAQALSRDPVVSFVRETMEALGTDTQVLGDEIEAFLGAEWAESSRRRYTNGLRRYVRWLKEYGTYTGQASAGE